MGVFAGKEPLSSFQEKMLSSDEGHFLLHFS